MIKYAIEYRALQNKLVTNDIKFKFLPKEEKKHLNECFMNLIMWWEQNKISPEDISIEEYFKLLKKDKKILIKCLEIPDKWKIHPQLNYSFYKLKKIK